MAFVDAAAAARLGVLDLLGNMGPFLWFLLLLNAWFLLLYLLVKTGWMQRLGMSLFGPALMLKTGRGHGLLNFFARWPRLFGKGAAIGTYLTYVIMLLMSLVLIAQLWFIAQLPPEAAPSPRLILGIPGVNPIIPLGYGIVALIFAVVVHELSHGILARVYQLRVKTMGLLFLIIPIGAFVEPDEEELRAAPRKQRIRVFGAGPTSNLLFAFVFALLFSPILMGSATPTAGAPILGVESPSPACDAGLLPGWVITHFNPAGPDRAGAMALEDREDLADALNETSPGQTVYLFVRDSSLPSSSDLPECVNQAAADQGVFAVTPVTCGEQYGPENCTVAGGHPDPVNRTVIGVRLYPTQAVHDALVRPLAHPVSFLQYVSLPFAALQGQFPLAGAFQQFYEAPFHAPTFWILANLAYWLFWINLMLGLTNALPILPLDGGHMFRDLVAGWTEKLRPGITAERRDAIARRVSISVALFLFVLILLQFIGPGLIGLFR